MGATDANLAEFFDVSESTINLWKLEHPEFSESIKGGKTRADMHIVQRLFNRAEGAEWTEDAAIKVKKEFFENGKKVRTEEEVVVVPVRKAAAPDTTALIFWLKNRHPELWRDRREVTGADGDPLCPDGLNLALLAPETLNELLTISQQLASSPDDGAGEPGDNPA